jgi:hypothetical protein
MPYMKISNINSSGCYKNENFEKKYTLLTWIFLDFKRKIHYLSSRQKKFGNFIEHARNKVGC